jgi:hypothetical protein
MRRRSTEMPRKKPAPPAKPLAIRSATEAEVRRLFEDLLRQRLPMAPDPVPPRPPETPFARAAALGKVSEVQGRSASRRICARATPRPKAF